MSKSKLIFLAINILTSITVSSQQLFSEGKVVGGLLYHCNDTIASDEYLDKMDQFVNECDIQSNLSNYLCIELIINGCEKDTYIQFARAQQISKYLYEKHPFLMKKGILFNVNGLEFTENQPYSSENLIIGAIYSIIKIER